MKKVLSAIALILALLVLGGITVFAADSFGYLDGQARSAERNELYAEAETLPEDEQDAFLAENGIGEEQYSEEAAADYSYVAGQQNGAQYEDDSEDKTGYAYLDGQARGASYRR